MNALKQTASFANLEHPLAFYVTDRKGLRGDGTEDLAEQIRIAIVARCDFVQVREKDLSPRELFHLAKRAVADAAGTSSTGILVNDRLDVALAAGAAGVHLGETSLPLLETNRCTVKNPTAAFITGVSCHSLEQALAAETDGASYVFFGPIFDTPSKREFGSPQGLERLERVCGSVKIPVVAIGGINEVNLAQCLDAGASGIAAIRLFQEAPDARSLGAIIGRIHALKRK